MKNKSGYVYILTNPALTYLKIGRTIDIEKRSEKLDKDFKKGAGFPSKYKVAYKIFVDDYVDIENKIHKKLKKYRVYKNKEFFEISQTEAINALFQIISDEKNQKNIDFNNKQVQQDPINLEENKANNGNLDFNQKQINIEESKVKWNNLDFNHKQIIKNHIILNDNFTEEELIESLRNIIDYCIDKKERKIVLNLYENIDYRKKIKGWFSKLPEKKQQMIKSYSNKELTDNEFKEILNLSIFDCRKSKFITKIEPITILKKLNKIDLSHTRIKNLIDIDKFDKLIEIHFNQTSVKDLIPLKKLERLELIYAIGSKIEKKDVNFFKLQKNNCKIITKSFMN